MATIVQTVTLDSAFLREIKEDDCRLRFLINHLRQLVESRPLMVSDGLRAATLLKDVRDHLAFHFTLEEAYGYFEDPVTVAPRLSERAELLREEHGDLSAAVEQIVEMMEDWSCEDLTTAQRKAVEEMCRDFLRRFDLHEAQENALIMQAFNEDIGGED